MACWPSPTWTRANWFLMKWSSRSAGPPLRQPGFRTMPASYQHSAEALYQGAALRLPISAAPSHSAASQALPPLRTGREALGLGRVHSSGALLPEGLWPSGHLWCGALFLLGLAPVCAGALLCAAVGGEQIVKDRLTRPDAEDKGWLLDGFPRSASQGNALVADGIVPDAFVLLNVQSPAPAAPLG